MWREVADECKTKNHELEDYIDVSSVVLDDLWYTRPLIHAGSVSRCSFRLMLGCDYYVRSNFVQKFLWQGDLYFPL